MMDLITCEEQIRLKQVFNVPIMDYFNSQVYCLGYFRKPTEEEIRLHSKQPFAIFEPAELHGWKISYYSINEVMEQIARCKPI